MTKPDLGQFGVFHSGATPDQAKEIEALGYGAVWVGGSPPAELDWVEPLLEATNTLQVATGIVNIWTAAPGPVAESFHRIEKAYPGRFLLGIGVGHPEAHTEHTAQAREIIGPDAFLAPEHKVVPTTDPEKARAVGRKALGIYLNLANYLNSWKRLGFTDDDVAKPGSDALVDSVVAYGTPEQIAARLHQHLDAGADHVPVQVLASPDKLVAALAELAGPLGLTAR
jgi:alkanesulfonate monooxygenase SsuD/methylene tetrahydromethanopterin reductase-like flavin-dependent oxidoreductase (luciferase family)